MEKKYIAIIAIVLILITITVIILRSPSANTWKCNDGVWVKYGNPKTPMPTTACRETMQDDSDVACTLEAKVCPDGSAVGRTGPNCEFSACPAINSIYSPEEARIMAEESCVKEGESLGNGIFNEDTESWWYDADLNSVRDGCIPSCVVDEKTKTAGIHWECIGVK